MSKIKFVVIVGFMFIMTGVFAADPVAAESSPWYMNGLTALFMSAITYFVIPFLKAKSLAASEEAKLHVFNQQKSITEQKVAFFDMVRAYIFTRAEAIGEKQWPLLCKKIVSKQINTVTDVKAELYLWHQTLRDEVVAFFKTQNIDVLGELGTKTVDQWIESAANEVSPFPGKETAVAVLEDNVANTLIEKGVEWMKSYLNSTAPVAAHVDATTA